MSLLIEFASNSHKSDSTFLESHLLIEITIINNTDIPVKYRGKRDSGGIYGSTSSVMGFFLLDGAKAENWGLGRS